MPDGVGLSIQAQLYPELTCFGCGHATTKGLRLRSYLRDGVATTAFQPCPEHDNGFGFLNGGIISAVLDCHSAAAVMAEAVQRGWLAQPGGQLYLTAGLEVTYLRPTPLHETSESAMALWRRWCPR